MMKKIFTFKKEIIIAITLAALLPFTASAQTPPAGNLIVEFESAPLFQELNFIPGDSVTRWVKVTNNTGGAEDIIVDAINVTDADNLGSAFSILIKKGATTVYSGTLAGLFSAGEVLLSNVLGNGGQAQYFFTAQFLGPSGDEFQEKTLGFDLLVGFSGGTVDGPGAQPITIVTTSIGGEGGGGGGGGNGPYAPDGLTIYNEVVLTGTAENAAAAVITWNTNYPATSRVVYGTTSGVFNYNNPPNYGYEFSTALFDTPAGTNGVTNHMATLTGLTLDVVYYYRVISTASPPTVGFERSFVARAGVALPEGGNGNNENGNTNSIFVSASSFGTSPEGESNFPGGSATGTTSSAFGFTGTTSENGIEMGDGGNEGSFGEGQRAQASFGDIGGWWWFLLLILILLLIIWLMSRRKSQQ